MAIQSFSDLKYCQNRRLLYFSHTKNRSLSLIIRFGKDGNFTFNIKQYTYVLVIKKENVSMKISKTKKVFHTPILQF